MVKRTLLLICLIIMIFSLLGCQTANGLREDAQFVGDKTYEILDGD